MMRFKFFILLKLESIQVKEEKMNILLACGGGMSSSILATALAKEAAGHQQDWHVHETSIDKVEDDLNENDYQVILLAPQVSFKKKDFEEVAAEKNVKFVLIPMTMYTPAKVDKLYELIVKETE